MDAPAARPNVIEKLVRRPWRDNLLLAEALVTLGVSAAMIAFLRFTRVAALMNRRAMGEPPAGADRALLVRRVRWAVVAASRRVPWRAMCFEQGLTAQWMLRRRSVPVTLHYGVAREDGELQAHVWVRDGEQAVTGCEVAPRFTEMAVFPISAPGR